MYYVFIMSSMHYVNEMNACKVGRVCPSVVFNTTAPGTDLNENRCGHAIGDYPSFVLFLFSYNS
jgi:hypothetical protein